MSIAEMIMQGGNQQSKNWSVLSENLGKLGQQVGNQLAMREYQKQAAEALPAMQAAYRSAMDDVSMGSVSEGYKKFMDAQFQFGTSQNPFIADAAKNAGGILGQAFVAYEKQQQRQAQYGGGSGGVGGGPRMPQGPAAFFNQSPPTTETNYSGEGEGMGGAGNVDRQPANQPVALWADQIDAEATNGLPVMQGSTAQQQNPFEENWSFTIDGYNPPTKEFEKKALEDNKEFINSPPEKQQKFKDSVSSTVNPRGTEFIEAPGLSNFKGFEDISGIYIPKETYIQFPESLSLQEDEKGSKYTTKFVQKTVNQQQMDKANALAYTDLPTAIRRINDNQTLQRFFTENTPDQLDVGETTKDMEGGKQFVGYIGVRGTDNYIDLSKDDLAAARIITGLPSTSKTLLSPLAKAERPTAPKATTEPPPPAAAAPAAPATAAMPTAPDNPFAAPAEKETTARAETTEKKTKEARKTEIKRLTEQMQRLAPPQTVSLMALETGGAQGMPGVMQDPAQQAKLKQQYDELYYRRDKLVAVDEGRVFATKEEAKASKKKFTSGTIIYVGGIPAKVK